MCALSRFSPVLETFFPALCPGCDGILPGGLRGLCAQCLSQLLPLEDPLCPLCGKPALGLDSLCASCMNAHPVSSGSVIWGEYQGILRKSLLALKHGGRDELLPLLAGRLAGVVAAAPWLPDVALITAVPSHPLYRFRRGYAAAEILAAEVARLLGLKYSSLLRRHGLRRQVQGSRKMREGLQKKSFRLKTGLEISGRGLLVIDDVTTTGTTLRRVVHLLRQGGAPRVYTAALAWSAPSGSWG